MQKLRILLYPFALIYGLIVWTRNNFFDKGWFRSFDIPGKSILIGNLSVGGTGKSPLVEYLIDHFLEEHISVSTLSRGYGRKTRGFREVYDHSIASEVGDEPLVYKKKFKDRIRVFVGEDRATAIMQIRNGSTDVILLDDAYQHRAVKAGFNILLTTWNAPYFRDHLLPAGNLREGKKGVKRADLLIITKCPSDLTMADKDRFLRNIDFPKERIFFASITYGMPFSPEETTGSPKNILLVTGIANPEPLLRQLEKNARVEHLRFPDHHTFNAGDLQRIHDIFDSFATSEKAIFTTEKDFVRIVDNEQIQDRKKSWFVQPIKVSIDREEEFKNIVNEYVRKN